MFPSTKTITVIFLHTFFDYRLDEEVEVEVSLILSQRKAPQYLSNLNNQNGGGT